LRAATKLSGVSSELGSLPDLESLGAKVGDIRAVLGFDEETGLLTTALVQVAVEAAGEKLELQLTYRLTSWNEPVEIPQPAA